MFWLLSILSLAVVSAQGQIANISRRLTPDDGWVQLQYGQVGEQPFSYFNFDIGLMSAGRGHGMKKCYLEVTDAYCPGDRLQVIRLNASMSEGNPILLTTPAVPYNNITAQEICDGFPVQCAQYTLNPEVAYNDPTWSSGKVLLKTGHYQVAIVPYSSPYCSGGAFVRLHCKDEHHPHPPVPPKPGKICQTSQAGLHVITTPVEGPKAGDVCAANGMHLALITNDNFIPATNVAFACSGAQSTTWIGAWNGQTWAGQEGLGLTVASVPGGGAINTFNDGKRRNVMCQE